MAVRAPCDFDGAVTGSWQGAAIGGIAQGKTMDLDMTRGEAESYQRRCRMNGLGEKVGGEGHRTDCVEH